MARRRVIDPDFFLDEKLSECNPYSRLLYIGLWGICDDHFATLPNKPRWIKAQVFPYNEGVDVEKYIKELIEIGCIIPFEENDEDFLFIKNFFKYQRVDRPSKAKYPEYRGILDEPSTSPRTEVKLREVKLSKEKREPHQLKEYLKSEECLKYFFNKYPTVMERSIRNAIESADNWLGENGVTKKDYRLYANRWILRDLDKLPKKPFKNTWEPPKSDKDDVSEFSKKIKIKEIK